MTQKDPKASDSLKPRSVNRRKRGKTTIEQSPRRKLQMRRRSVHFKTTEGFLFADSYAASDSGFGSTSRGLQTKGILLQGEVQQELSSQGVF